MTPEERLRVVWDSRERDAAAILAMQRRIARWLGPLHILWRKPWRSPSSLREVMSYGDTPAIRLRNGWAWLRAAHDCADPSVACSCSGGFRQPRSTR